MNINDIKVGMRLTYRPNFGTGTPLIGTVSGTGENKGRDVVDFTTGNWAYLSQVDGVYEL